MVGPAVHGAHAQPLWAARPAADGLEVVALQAVVSCGTKVSNKEFTVSTELLIRQLLKLDNIEAEGEARVHRKDEVRRVRDLMDTLDTLKARNSDMSKNNSNDMTSQNNNSVTSQNSNDVASQNGNVDSGVDGGVPQPQCHLQQK